jgi:hypothetical protein
MVLSRAGLDPSGTAEQIQAKRVSIKRDPKALQQVAVRNFFAPLRTQMGAEDSNDGKTTGTEKAEQKPANQAFLPPQQT